MCVAVDMTSVNWPALLAFPQLGRVLTRNDGQCRLTRNTDRGIYEYLDDLIYVSLHNTCIRTCRIVLDIRRLRSCVKNAVHVFCVSTGLPVHSPAQPNPQ